MHLCNIFFFVSALPTLSINVDASFLHLSFLDSFSPDKCLQLTYNHVRWPLPVVHRNQHCLCANCAARRSPDSNHSSPISIRQKKRATSYTAETFISFLIIFSILGRWMLAPYKTTSILKCIIIYMIYFFFILLFYSK